MSGLGRIMGKEIRELLTPATLVPIIIMAIIFGSLGNAFSSVAEEADEKPEFGLVVEDNGDMGMVAKYSLVTHGVILYNGTDLNDGINKLKDGGSGGAMLYVPGNFTENIENGTPGWVGIYYLKTGTGISEMIRSGLVQSAVMMMEDDISAYMIMTNRTQNASLVLSPVNVFSTTYLNDNAMVGVTPEEIDSVFQSSGFVVPLIVMLVIIMAGSMVISSMGNEKENKTLETLLTLPVKRTWIVFGKLAGATVVGLIVSFIYMLGLGYYYSSLMVSAPIDLETYGLTLGILDYILIGISLFLALLCGLALCMILGIFTKNYKAAQTMTLPVTMLALIPMMISFFSDFEGLPSWLQAIVFAIPFSHPMFAVNNLLLDNYLVVLAGIVYMAFFAMVTMALAVSLFKKDILLTGRVRSAEGPLRKGVLFKALLTKRR
ncbi:MAG: ABC transporter permease [Methanomassiliicoccales archaeon]|nr:MAG: ABC transporter permease [Methanomassiliicoccales archaeon]